MEILNSYEVYTNEGFLDIFFAFALIGVLASVVLVVWNMFDGDYRGAVFFGIVGAICLVFILLTNEWYTAQHTEYEVIVTDYNELHEGGYEIVEERGDITVIKEAE